MRRDVPSRRITLVRFDARRIVRARVSEAATGALRPAAANTGLRGAADRNMGS